MDGAGSCERFHAAASTIKNFNFWQSAPIALNNLDITDFAQQLGITRIASTKLLDRISIPTYYCIRPSARHPACVYSSGKAYSKPLAYLGCIFEAYER
jgi:ribosomal protein S12 methylthiotransferase accessory factor YcaO